MSDDRSIAGRARRREPRIRELEQLWLTLNSRMGEMARAEQAMQEWRSCTSEARRGDDDSMLKH